ncbi:MAG: hypothetical protein M0C28_36215 [Candidatus Moduliflexus flocculans]|nr:hypothetical protein [Candidatus Moduliflexus flocculans]
MSSVSGFYCAVSACWWLASLGYGYYAYTQIAPTLTSADPIFPIETTSNLHPDGTLPPDRGSISNETLETLSQSVVP